MLNMTSAPTSPTTPCGDDARGFWVFFSSPLFRELETHLKSRRRVNLLFPKTFSPSLLAESVSLSVHLCVFRPSLPPSLQVNDCLISCSHNGDEEKRNFPCLFSSSFHSLRGEATFANAFCSVLLEYIKLKLQSGVAGAAASYCFPQSHQSLFVFISVISTL